MPGGGGDVCISGRDLPAKPREGANTRLCRSFTAACQVVPAIRLLHASVDRDRFARVSLIILCEIDRD